VVSKDKEGVCCSSRRLIDSQSVFARVQAGGAGVVQEPAHDADGDREGGPALVMEKR